MMKNKEILIQFLKQIHSHLQLTIADFEDILAGNVNDGIHLLKQNCQNLLIDAFVDFWTEAKLKTLLSSFDLNFDFENDPYPNTQTAEIIDFSQPNFLKRNRAFTFLDNNFSYISFKHLFTSSPISTFSDNDGLKALWDFMATAIIANEMPKINQLLAAIINRDTEKGFLVNKTAQSADALSIYACLFYQKLLSGETIALDNALISSPSTHTHSFVQTHKYEQYFELFDVIAELNNCKDLITRFLKVYHLLEYLAFRVQLVKIEANARLNRTFMRDIHSLGDNRNELSFLKKQFLIIFQGNEPDFNAIFSGLAPDILTFIKNHFDIGVFHQMDQMS